MSVFFSAGSLGLGLIAWIIPIIAMNRRKGKTDGMTFCLLSFSCCAIALVLQLFEIKHRVNIEDWSAIMDTIGAVSGVSVVLVAVTVFLNTLAIAVLKSENDG